MSAWGRPLAIFLSDMAERLEANDHKTGWDHMSLTQLLQRLRQETGELERAIAKTDAVHVDNGSIIKEAADVANFAMMIADNARSLSAAKDT